MAFGGLLVAAVLGVWIFEGGDDAAGPGERSPGPRAPIAGTAYHVSPEGSDDADGTSPQRAWRTIARANEQELRPGDAVLLEGGAELGDEELVADTSGTRERPIVYGSYGDGRARLTRSVFLRGASWVVVRDLEIQGAEQGIASLASAPAGARGVTIAGNRIRDAGIAINSAHEGDSGWTIEGNDVARSGDSALIVTGERARIAGNTIVDSGLDRSIDYGKHGVYLKGAHGTVTDNRIRGFPDGSGVSVRRHDSRVERNDISGGPVGISWFQEDETAGTSRWIDNRITGTTRACIYVSPSDVAGETRERFVIRGNVLRPAGGVALDVPDGA